MAPHESHDTPSAASGLAQAQTACCGASNGPNRTDLYFAAINCGHSITDERVILYRNSSLPGNALSQLADRLIAAVREVQS